MRGRNLERHLFDLKSNFFAREQNDVSINIRIVISVREIWKKVVEIRQFAGHWNIICKREKLRSNQRRELRSKQTNVPSSTDRKLAFPSPLDRWTNHRSIRFLFQSSRLVEIYRAISGASKLKSIERLYTTRERGWGGLATIEIIITRDSREGEVGVLIFQFRPPSVRQAHSAAITRAWLCVVDG